MSQSIGQISLDLGINQKPFQSQMDSLAKSTKKSVGILGIAVGNAMSSALIAAVRGMGDFIKSSIQLGSDLEEVQNVTNTVFPGMADEVDSWAKSAAASFGLSELTAKKYLGTLGAMSTSFGFAQDDAMEMSETLAGLAGDVASFYNITSDEAYTKLKSVFTGETESLKELGVVMTQNALDQYALEQGWNKTTSAMTEQEKVALRYAFVQDKLRVAAGDFARTSNSWANQVRILSLQFQSLKSTIGQGLINVLTPVLKVLNMIIAKLQVAANAFKRFTEIITGKKSASNSVSQLAASTEQAAAGAAGTADAMKDTAKAATKAKTALSGLDELNTFSVDTGSSGSDAGGVDAGAGGAADTGTALATPEIDTTSVDKTLEKLHELTGIDFGPLVDSFGRLKEAMAPFTSIIGAGLKWLLDNVLKPLAKWTVEDVLPAFLDTLSGIISVITQVLIAFQPLAEWLWVSFLQPIAAWTGGVIVSALQGLADALKGISDWMAGNQKLVSTTATVIAGFFAAWKTTQVLAFVQMSGGVVSALKSITTMIKAATIAKLADKAETVILTAMYAKDFVVSVASGTAALVKQAAQWVVVTALKLADAVQTGLATAAQVAWNACAVVGAAATTALGIAFSILTSPITLVVLAIGAVIAAGVLLYKNWDVVKEKAKKFGDKITDVFKTVRDFLKDVFDGISAGFKSAVNAVIGALNVLIKGLNKLKIDIPGWVPVIGGKSFGFNVPLIPKLAEGGYIKANQPQLAVVGDNKREGEIVAPESKLKEMAKEAVRLSNNSSSGSQDNSVIVDMLYSILGALQSMGDGNLVVELDGDTIYKNQLKVARDRGANLGMGAFAR